MKIKDTDLLQVWDGDTSSYKYVTWSQIASKEIPNPANTFLVIERYVGDTWTQYQVSVDDFQQRDPGIRYDDLYLVQRDDKLYHTKIEMPIVFEVYLDGSEFVIYAEAVGGPVYIEGPGGAPLYVLADGEKRTFHEYVVPAGVWTIKGSLKDLKFDGKGVTKLDGRVSSSHLWNEMLENSPSFGREAFMNLTEVHLPSALILKDGYKTFYGTNFTERNSIKDLDTLGVSNMESMFQGITGSSGLNLDNMDVSGVTNFRSLFESSEIKGRITISGWDTFNVTDMSRVFRNSDSLEMYTNGWNTAKVSNLEQMAQEANSIAFEVDDWDTQNVVNLTSAFAGSKGFNQRIEKWNTGKVQSFHKMFENNRGFNQTLNKWDVTSATEMSYMFSNATDMGGDCSEWCVTQFKSQPNDFSSEGCPMPQEHHPKWGQCPARVINDPIIKDAETGGMVTCSYGGKLYMSVRGETSPEASFDKFWWYRNPVTAGSPGDDKPYEEWDLVKTNTESNVEYQTGPSDREHAIVLKQEADSSGKSATMWSNPITPTVPYVEKAIYFRVGGVGDIHMRSNGTSPEQIYKLTGGQWTPYAIIEPKNGTATIIEEGVYAVEARSSFKGWATAEGGQAFQENGPPWKWRSDPGATVEIAQISCMRYITVTKGMFASQEKYNANLDWWTPEPTDTSEMFLGCLEFNQSVNHFDMSNCKSTRKMFGDCRVFNQRLDKWDTSKVEEIAFTFLRCEKFNQSLSSWDMSSVMSGAYFLHACVQFNKPIAPKSFAFGAQIHSFFNRCTVFNQSMKGFDVSNAENLDSFFFRCIGFNQSLADWNPSNSTTLRYTFSEMYLNVSMSHFDTRKVTNMYCVFMRNPVFNQDIGYWKISGVTDARSCFGEASLFNKDISSWDWTNADTGNWNRSCPISSRNYPKGAS